MLVSLPVERTPPRPGDRLPAIANFQTVLRYSLNFMVRPGRRTQYVGRVRSPERKGDS
jgi:hypothetical protein